MQRTTILVKEAGTAAKSNDLLTVLYERVAGGRNPFDDVVRSVYERLLIYDVEQL